MEYRMPYGKEIIPIIVPNHIKQIELDLSKQSVVDNPKEKLRSTLEHPIHSDSLKNLLHTKKPNSIVLVVDDQTRKFPHKLIVIPLLEYLEQEGIPKSNITLLIASGVHRRPTKEELINLFGRSVVQQYTIEWNDQENGEFIDFGFTSRGTPVKYNRIYVNAEFKILVTDVTLHYFAGFGGDRKSIFPGVASADSINKNHSLVMLGIYPGKILHNPIHEDMTEAAHIVGADFVVNVCLDSEGNILDIKSGALKDAFLEAVKAYQDTCVIHIKEQADALILSSGGYPFDSNYQQSMKAIMQCQDAVKPGGKVLYFLKGENGIGIPAFKNYLDQFTDSHSILEYTQFHEYKQGMHNTYYYRKFTEEHDTYYFTELPKEYVQNTLRVNYVENIQESIEHILQNVKLVYIIRHGTKMLVKHKA